MPVTKSVHGAVIMATAQDETIPGKFFKAWFWVVSGATVGTHKLELTEGDGSGHRIYQDAASKTDGAIPIPTPHGAVNNVYIKDLDNGYILAYPVNRAP